MCHKDNEYNEIESHFEKYKSYLYDIHLRIL